MLNLTRLHLGIAHESQFQGLGIRGYYLLFCYFATSLFVRYAWMRYGPSHEAPFVRVVSACWFGDQPAVSNQNRGCVDRGFWISEGGGTELPDIFHPDDVFSPALDEPIKQLLCQLEFRIW